jgi:hypothetical protein
MMKPDLNLCTEYEQWAADNVGQGEQWAPQVMTYPGRSKFAIGCQKRGLRQIPDPQLVAERERQLYHLSGRRRRRRIQRTTKLHLVK